MVLCDEPPCLDDGYLSRTSFVYRDSYGYLLNECKLRVALMLCSNTRYSIGTISLFSPICTGLMYVIILEGKRFCPAFSPTCCCEANGATLSK